MTRATMLTGLSVKRVVLRAHWTGDEPRPGDYMVSDGRDKRAYKIISTRTARSLRYPLRLVCQRVTFAQIPIDALIHGWHPHPRGQHQPLRSPLL